MNQRQRARYVVAVYLFILATATALGLFAIYELEDAYQALSLSLAASLLSVALLFFVLHRFFLDEWQARTHLDTVIRRLEEASASAGPPRIQKRTAYAEHLETARHIWVCGISATGVMSERAPMLRDRLRAGATIQLIVLDPTSSAVDFASLRSAGRDSAYYRQRVETVLKDVQHLQELQTTEAGLPKEHPDDEQVQVRLLPYPPSFGITAFDATLANGTIFVEIYPHRTADHPPILKLSRAAHGAWYQFFLDQFELLWQQARPWPSDELLDLVDTSDHVIGQELRSLIYKAHLTNFRVVNAFLVDSRNRIWIPMRASTKKLFALSLDSSVGGHVRSGESYDEALRRELREELNVELDKVDWRRLGSLTPHKDGVSAFMEVYEIRTDVSPDYNPWDFVSARWMEVDALMSEISAGARRKSDLPILLKRFYAKTH